MKFIIFIVIWCPGRESNPQLSFRRALLYPFNYQDRYLPYQANIIHIGTLHHFFHIFLLSFLLLICYFLCMTFLHLFEGTFSYQFYYTLQLFLLSIYFFHWLYLFYNILIHHTFLIIPLFINSSSVDSNISSVSSFVTFLFLNESL